jgi:hypothetical protein
MIVTTSVRFFESLFSNRPGDLRRVHNIARSIVILDEVQVLPRSLLAPLIDMMKELSDHWGCTFVLSTATKPAFEKADPLDRTDPRWPPGTVREIIADPDSLHARLRRVTIDWRITEAVDWPEVAGWMREHRRALCVVNVRDHAVRLFQILADGNQGFPQGVFHLSSRMCPAHRLDTIAVIRRRLIERLPCMLGTEWGTFRPFCFRLRTVCRVRSTLLERDKIQRLRLQMKTPSPAGNGILNLGERSRVIACLFLGRRRPGRLCRRPCLDRAEAAYHLRPGSSYYPGPF